MTKSNRHKEKTLIVKHIQQSPKLIAYLSFKKLFLKPWKQKGKVHQKRRNLWRIEKIEMCNLEEHSLEESWKY